MKINSFALRAVGVLTLAACFGFADRGYKPNRDPKLLSFIMHSNYVPVPGDSDVLLNISDTGSATTAHYEATRSTEEIAGFSPNAGIVWPGAIIQGKGINTGVFASINVQRAPLTINLTTVGLRDGGAAPISETILHPGGSTVEAARQRLTANAPLNVPAKFLYFVKDFYSLEHAMLQIGASVSWLGGGIKASLSSDRYASQSNLIVKFTQEYYTIATEPPSSPTAYFSNKVKVPDLTPYANTTDNPITYVQSVTYGRMVLLMLSSSASKETLREAVEAEAHMLTGSGGVSLTHEQERVLQSSEAKLLVLGGNPGEALKAIDGDRLKELNEYIKVGAHPDVNSLGYPISYRLSYLKDNQPAKVSFTTQYQIVGQKTLAYLGYGGNALQGSGSTSFSDPNVLANSTVVAVRVRHGKLIDSLQLVFKDGVSEKHGGNGGSEPTFQLNAGEYLTAISGASGDALDSIQFTTNTGRQSPLFGGPGGSPYRFAVKDGYEIVGLAGANGVYAPENRNVVGKIGVVCRQRVATPR